MCSLKLLIFIHYIDDDTSFDVAGDLIEDKEPTPISRKLFSHNQLPTSDADNDLYGVSPNSKHANLDDDLLSAHIGFDVGTEKKPVGLGLSDEDRLQTLVISSSEDETDHLERVAETFSTKASPRTPTTPPPSRPRSSRLARRRRVIPAHYSDSNVESGSKQREAESPTKTKRPRNRLQSGTKVKPITTNESPAPSGKRSLRSSTITQRQNEALQDLSKVMKSSPSDSDDVTMTTRRGPRLRTAKISDGDDSDIVVRRSSQPRRSLTRSKPTPVVIPDDSDESSEEVVTPSRKRRVVRVTPASPKLQSEDATSPTADDLEEDVNDLKDTELRSHRTRTTNRTPRKTKVQQQLELLKRRRAGQKIEEVSSESDEVGTPSPTSRKESRDAVRETSEDASDEPEQYEDIDPPLVRRGENLDQYEEDFVIEDGDELLGVPDEYSEMPLEFTRHAHKKPIEHFKDVVEWMVHNKLNPAFPRHDPIYQVAVQKLDDEVRGLAGSKFMSAAWNAEFLNTLKARPEIASLDAPGLFEQHCAACNKSNHPAKFQLIFSGKQYDRHSLESISDDEDEEPGVEDHDDLATFDEKTFYVGRTCCANAETAHALHHWRYALNHWVLEWLVRRGHTSPEKIIAREHWNTKRRTKYANEVVDEMDNSGEVRVLYKEFKENLQAARDARVSLGN